MASRCLGQTPPSGVTGVTTAKNTSAFSVTNLTITDPSTTAPSDFSQVIPIGLQLVFPTGATTATGTVICSDGSTFPISATAPPTTVRPTLTGCPAGATGTSVTVTYTGTIPPGASAQLDVHAVLKPTAVGGEALSDCSDASIAGGSSGGASGTGCASLTIQNPTHRGRRRQELLQPVHRRGLGAGPDDELHGPGHQPGESAGVQLRDRRPLQPAADHQQSLHVPDGDRGVGVDHPDIHAGAHLRDRGIQRRAWVPFSPAAAVGATGIRARLTGGLVTPNQTRDAEH